MLRVEWRQSAVDDLARFWTQADPSSRRALTAASHEIDRRLQDDPQHQGESRDRGRRITFVPPLDVTFRVDSARKTATVVEIRFFRPRSG